MSLERFCFFSLFASTQNLFPNRQVLGSSTGQVLNITELIEDGGRLVSLYKTNKQVETKLEEVLKMISHLIQGKLTETKTYIYLPSI